MSTDISLTLYPFPGTHHDAAPVSFYWYADTPDELEVRDERGLVIDNLLVQRGQGPIKSYITWTVEDYCAEHGINPADCSEEWGTPT